MGEAAPPAPIPFGKYLLDREIARGGMARVWLGRLRGQGGFEKRLVVKQILPHLAGDPRFVALFVEEAKTLVQLSHPHVVPVYELGVVDGTWFLAMEHVEGATLAAILGSGPLDPSAVAHLGVQICDALAYAHDRFGLVHRDVTPRNVIVEGSGHARLLDFGIAARVGEEKDEGRGAVYGTPGYVSPEQARGETLDARSDLFSLGCLLFEALSGAPAFPPTDLDRVRKLEADGVPPLEGPLGEIVRRCLEPDAAARPASAKELGRSLRAFLKAHDDGDPAYTLGERAQRARDVETSRALDPRAPPVTPSAGRAEDRSLATSRLLDEIVAGKTPATARASVEPREPEPPAAGDAAEAAPGTLRLDRPKPGAAATAPEIAAPSTAATTPDRPPAASPSGERPSAVTIAATVALSAIALFLVARAGYDPPVADPELRETDVDGTMWIEPSDGDLLDGGAPAPDAGSALDAPGPSDAGAAVSGREDARRARQALISVRGGGNARVRIDRGAWADIPESFAISAGEHTLSAECPALGTSGRETFTAEAGSAIAAGVDCSRDPVRITISAHER